jgi:hypothetical protein
MSDTRWQKSSYSADGENNACVEMAREADGLLLRESDDSDTIATASRARAYALLEAVKRDRFGHIA